MSHSHGTANTTKQYTSYSVTQHLWGDASEGGFRIPHMALMGVLQAARKMHGEGVELNTGDIKGLLESELSNHMVYYRQWLSLTRRKKSEVLSAMLRCV